MKTISLIALLFPSLILIIFGFIQPCEAGIEANLNFEDSTITKITQLYKMEAEYQHLSGVVLVKKNGNILYANAFGKATENENNNLKTKFEIGSITKQFTAAAILKLSAEGHFGLNDLINPLLGKFASDRWKKVTVHQLLTHTSGIPSIYQTEQGIEIFMPGKDPVEIEQLIGKFKEAKLLFKPGEEFGYSNSGYVLLAAIIEQVTQSNYFDYLEQELFKRYGLNNTSFHRDTHAANPFYGYRDDLMEKAPIFHHSWMVGGGGVYSTVEDLSKWVAIIQSDEFLDEDYREKLLKSYTGSGYGYGWLFDEKGRFQHDGGNAGFMSYLCVDPKENTQVILLTNRSYKDIHMYGKSSAYVKSLVDKTWDILGGENVAILPKRTPCELVERSFATDKNLKVSIKPQNDTIIKITAEKMQPSRIVSNTPLKSVKDDEQKLIAVANALYKKKYWKLARYCDGEMSFVCYAGIMSVGMNMMKKQTGPVSEIIPCYVNEEIGLMRMKGELGSLDLIAYFDEEGKIQGIFENGFEKPDQEITMLAYAIGNDQFYLDGLPYGEKSSYITIQQNELIFEYKDRKVILGDK